MKEIVRAKVDSKADRNRIILALTDSGYVASVDRKPRHNRNGYDYQVIIYSRPTAQNR